MRTKTIITVDARGAGEGKTTTGIYPMLNLNQSLDINTLLVVPSKHLQEQYAKQYAHTHKFRVINSELNADSVVKKIMSEMLLNDGQTICITHEAFMRLQVDANLKEKWALIIDEAFVPVRSITWEANKNSIDWSALLITPPDFDEADEVPFVKIKINQDQDDSWTAQIRDIQNLKNPQWITYARASSIRAMKSSTAKRAEFFQMLDVSKVTGWLRVHIAAAAFDQTFMAYWLTFNEQEVTIIHPFVKRKLPVVLHVPQELNWSMYKQKNAFYKDIMSKYHEYVRSVCLDKQLKPLRLFNKVNRSDYKDEFQELSHNVHGINEYSHYKAVSIESAINPSNEFVAAIQQIMEVVDIKTDEIIAAYSTYLFYQVLMRTALRNQNNSDEVHLFMLDFKSTAQLIGFFDFDINKIEFIDVGSIGAQKGRKKKYSSAAERQKAYRASKKQSKTKTS